MKIGVIGMGRLGYCLAAILAMKNKVVGVDIRWPIPIPDEPHLRDLLKKGDLKTTNNYEDLRNCEVIFCVTQTPSNKKGGFSDQYVINAIQSARPYMKNCKVFNLVSTVMPGTCERLQKKLSKGTYITYNPEFIAQGEIVNGMINPDFVLIGGDNQEAKNILSKIYTKITKAPIEEMGLRSAELAKISLNAYVTMKISFANALSEISDKLGTDARRVCEAIGRDKRIGTKYLRPGSAYGGPCFPRDNRAFSHMAGNILNYSKLTDEINEHQMERVLKKIGKVKGKIISIMGTSYKHGTKITEESFGLKLTEELRRKGAKIVQDRVTDFVNLVVFTLPGYEKEKEMAAENKIPMLDLWK